MPMNSSFPDWLTPVAWVFLILAMASTPRLSWSGPHPLCAWDRWRWPCTPVTAALARRATLRETLSIRAAPHNRLP